MHPPLTGVRLFGFWPEDHRRLLRSDSLQITCQSKSWQTSKPSTRAPKPSASNRPLHPSEPLISSTTRSRCCTLSWQNGGAQGDNRLLVAAWGLGGTLFWGPYNRDPTTYKVQYEGLLLGSLVWVLGPGFFGPSQGGRVSILELKVSALLKWAFQPETS